MKNWDKILDDFARKCKGGAPDMTNPRHLALLRESLIKFGWKENAANEILGNLREAPGRKKVKIMPAPPTKAGTPRFYYIDPTDNQIVALVEPTGTKRGWAYATQQQVDADSQSGGDGVVDEKDIVRSMPAGNQKTARKNLFGTRGESKGRLHQDRLDQIEKNHPKEYPEYEEDIKQLESLFKEFTDPNTTPERKKEIALQLVTDYGLKTNRSTVNVEDPDNPRPRNVKLYITKLPDGKKVPRWLYKILSGGDGDPSGGGPNGPQSALTNSLNVGLISKFEKLITFGK